MLKEKFQVGVELVTSVSSPPTGPKNGRSSRGRERQRGEVFLEGVDWAEEGVRLEEINHHAVGQPCFFWRLQVDLNDFRDFPTTRIAAGSNGRILSQQRRSLPCPGLTIRGHGTSRWRLDNRHTKLASSYRCSNLIFWLKLEFLSGRPSSPEVFRSCHWSCREPGPVASSHEQYGIWYLRKAWLRNNPLLNVPSTKQGYLFVHFLGTYVTEGN